MIAVNAHQHGKQLFTDDQPQPLCQLRQHNHLCQPIGKYFYLFYLYLFNHAFSTLEKRGIAYQALSEAATNTTFKFRSCKLLWIKRQYNHTRQGAIYNYNWHVDSPNLDYFENIKQEMCWMLKDIWLHNMHFSYAFQITSRSHFI